MGDKPFPWTAAIEEEILSRIAKGQALRTVCADDWLPGVDTFYKRVQSDAGFSERYARAKERLADAIFEECLAIADSQEGDMIEVDGEERVNHDAIARAKLRIDTRKWMAGKLRPKVYGDKQVIEGPGPDGSHTVNTNLSEVELARRVAFTLASGIQKGDNNG
jgi:hypothetical protein